MDDAVPQRCPFVVRARVANEPFPSDLARRDTIDSSRRDSPLLRATGAVELDTTDIGVDGVVDRVVELIQARRHEG